MTNALLTVVIDVTPVLPGGENGGAKIVITELIRALARIAPKTRFVLLTQQAAHEELRKLERSNVVCTMVIGARQPTPTRLKRIADRALPRIPGRVRRVVARVGYAFNARRKRRGGALLHTLGADVLFCPFTAPTYAERGIPTVSTVHDVQSLVYPEFFTPADAAHRDLVFVEACRKATVLAAVSDYTRDSVIRFGGVDPQYVQTIYHRFAKRLPSPSPGDDEAFARFGIAPGRYLLYPANLWKHKNHEMLVAAFGIAAAEGLAADVKLVCTGAPGERLVWLSTAIAALGLSDRVLLVGFQSEEVLGTLLRGAMAMVFPSLFEGFGLPVVEAMTAGIPVACSNTTSLPEIAKDAALYFDPRVPDEIAAAIRQLAHDDEVRARLVDNGLRRGAEFADPSRMAREYFALFEFARANVRRTDFLSGAYPDGWIGPTLHVHVAGAKAGRKLGIVLFVPPWLPHAWCVVRIHGGELRRVESRRVARGDSLSVELSVQEQGANFDFEVSPTLVPRAHGFGEDDRELSVMLQECVVIEADGSRASLSNPQQSAT
jgi:glycosyltransferase involved in cell wall biosynthesis